MDTDWIFVKILKYDNGFMFTLLKRDFYLLAIHTKIVKDGNYMISGICFIIFLFGGEEALNGA